jgi:hypothetical protein
MEIFNADDVAVMAMMVAVMIDETRLDPESASIKSIYWRCKNSVVKEGSRNGKQVWRAKIRVQTTGRWGW